MNAAEAFAAILLTAVCCDHTFGTDEARVIREQLLSRSAYRVMEPYRFGLLISDLLRRFREESWQGMIAAAVPVLRLDHQETAFALACQLIHCDRQVLPAEREFLTDLADHLLLTAEKAQQILEVCELLNRDFGQAQDG